MKKKCCDIKYQIGNDDRNNSDGMSDNNDNNNNNPCSLSDHHKR